jgi:urease accessory protein UreH
MKPILSFMGFFMNSLWIKQGVMKMDLIVTAEELMEAAQCACRMTGYAKPDDNLLITRLTAEDGTQVRLFFGQALLRASRIL